MPDDVFDFFRYLLGTIATVYASVLTFQSLYGWYVWLAGGEKYVSIVRRYVLLHALRLRFKTFWGDVIVCILLTVIFFMLWHAHGTIRQLGRQLTELREPAENPAPAGAGVPPEARPTDPTPSPRHP